MTNLATTNPGHETGTIYWLWALRFMLFSGSRYHCFFLIPMLYALRSFPRPGTRDTKLKSWDPGQLLCSELSAYTVVHPSEAVDTVSRYFFSMPMVTLGAGFFQCFLLSFNSSLLSSTSIRLRVASMVMVSPFRINAMLPPSKASGVT